MNCIYSDKYIKNIKMKLNKDNFKIIVDIYKMVRNIILLFIILRTTFLNEETINTIAPIFQEIIKVFL